MMDNIKRQVLLTKQVLLYVLTVLALFACTPSSSDGITRESGASVSGIASPEAGALNTPFPSQATAGSTNGVLVRILEQQGGRVSWLTQSPGDLIAFDAKGKDRKEDVYTLRVDGTDKHCLTCDKSALPQLHIGNAEWDPSGQYIVFQAQDPDLHLPAGPLTEYIASPGIGVNNNLWLMNSDGTQFWQLTHVQNRHGTLHHQFSPDGKKLLWSELTAPVSDKTGQWAIKLADIAIVAGAPQLSNVLTLTPGNLQLYETHGFSPDGLRIIFSGVEQGKYYYDMEIYTYDLVSKEISRLTSNIEWDEHAHFSPDGKSIVWMSSRGIPQVKANSLLQLVKNPPKTDVWIMEADGSNPRRLTRFNDPNFPEGRAASGGVLVGDISWGPDSHSFVAKVQRGRNESIVLVEFDEAILTQAPNVNKSSQAIEPRSGAVYRDVTYCTPDGIAQKMDMAYPQKMGDRPLAATVFIHGGGWTQGNKDGGTTSLYARELLKRGYLVISLDYRLAPQYHWPAQITDVKCAIRHLRANAALYDLDPNRIGAWGSSAGGHLVSMLGTTDASAGFDVGEYLDQSSRVQAVADLFGPSDLRLLLGPNAELKGRRVFGTNSSTSPVITNASPVTYVSSDDPPFLILQGDQDRTVPPEQSSILYDRLRGGGVDATLVIVKNGGHGFTPVGGPISPTLQELAKTIGEFFDEHLP